jgi:phage tail-like protein
MAITGQSFSLQLTPMQIPEAFPASEVAIAWQGTNISAEPNLSLLLCPGEPSEMVVQVKNLGRHNLQLSLQVEGDFPSHWCRIGTEGSDILAGQQMDAVLYFQIAADFFERHESLSPHEKMLKLDYQGRLAVHSTEPHTGRRQIEFASFKLHLRPRSVYLDHLPDIYQEIDFVGRFLKIFEQAFEPAVNSLDSLWAYLDPVTAPQRLLPFLAHWVGWEPESYLPLNRQRDLIRHAMQIYRWRGTRRGLRFYLHLATGLPLDDDLEREEDKHIGISESFHRGFILGEATLGENATLGGGRPYHFSVQISVDDLEQVDERLVRSVIEQEKPAFCTYDLAISVRQEDSAPSRPLNPPILGDFERSGSPPELGDLGG